MALRTVNGPVIRDAAGKLIRCFGHDSSRYTIWDRRTWRLVDYVDGDLPAGPQDAGCGYDVGDCDCWCYNLGAAWDGEFGKYQRVVIGSPSHWNWRSVAEGDINVPGSNLAINHCKFGQASIYARAADTASLAFYGVPAGAVFEGAGCSFYSLWIAAHQAGPLYRTVWLGWKPFLCHSPAGTYVEAEATAGLYSVWPKCCVGACPTELSVEEHLIW